MKRRYIVLVLLLFAANLRAQTAKVIGTAVDSSEGRSRCRRYLDWPGKRARRDHETGPDGAFNIEAPPVLYALEIWADGFRKGCAGYICSRRQQPAVNGESIGRENHSRG